MSEEEQKQDGQKTIVAFIVGLLIGGLLVWVFSGSPAESPEMDVEDDSVNSEITIDGENTDDENDGGSDADTEPSDDTDDTGTTGQSMTIGEGSVDVEDQAAGMSVALEGAVFPTSEGWVGVRQYTNGQLGGLLGVVRYSEEQGLVPQNIVLQAPTTSGREYAIVFYSESGDREFSLADDVQMDEIAATFTAQ